MTVIGAYDPSESELLIDGFPVDTFGEGQLTLSRSEDLVVPKIGFQGDIHLEVSANRTGTLTFPLKAMSSWDNTMNELQGMGVTTFAVTYRVPSANIEINTVGWIQSQPDVSNGAELADREHVIGLADVSPSTINQVDSFAGQIKNWLDF